MPALGPPTFSSPNVTSTGKSKPLPSRMPSCRWPPGPAVVLTVTVRGLPSRRISSSLGFSPAFWSSSFSSARSVTVRPVDGDQLVPGLQRLRVLFRGEPGDGQVLGERDVQLVQRRGGGELLRVVHHHGVLFALLLAGGAARQHHFLGQHVLPRVDPPGEHVEEAQALLPAALHVDGCHVQRAAGRVGRLAGDGQHRGAIDLADSVQRRASRFHHEVRGKHGRQGDGSHDDPSGDRPAAACRRGLRGALGTCGGCAAPAQQRPVVGAVGVACHLRVRGSSVVHRRLRRSWHCWHGSSFMFFMLNWPAGRTLSEPRGHSVGTVPAYKHGRPEPLSTAHRAEFTAFSDVPTANWLRGPWVDAPGPGYR